MWMKMKEVGSSGDLYAGRLHRGRHWSNFEPMGEPELANGGEMVLAFLNSGAHFLGIWHKYLGILTCRAWTHSVLQNQSPYNLTARIMPYLA